MPEREGAAALIHELEEQRRQQIVLPGTVANRLPGMDRPTAQRSSARPGSVKGRRNEPRNSPTDGTHSGAWQWWVPCVRGTGCEFTAPFENGS